MLIRPLSVGVALCAGTIAAQGAEWLHDFETAKARAQAEQKAMLLFFTGSDWCGWCVRLHSSIFNSPEFTQWAQDKFVLVEVDMPQNTAKLPPQLLAQNKALVSQYHISTYPTVLILSAEETVLGGFIGGRDTQQQVFAPLEQALQNQQKMAAAAQLDSADKAGALMQIYSQVPASLKPYFRPMRDEIAQCDPQNATGIHTEIADTTQLEQLQALIDSAGTDYTPVLRSLQQAYEQASTTNKKAIRQLQLNYLEQTQQRLVMTAQSTQDVEKLKEVLLEIANISSPEDAASLKREIELMFCDPQQVLQALKAKQQKK